MYPVLNDPAPQALRLSDPQELGYVIRWPIYGGNFNTRDYPTNSLILSDIETIIGETLKDKFNISQRQYKVSSTQVMCEYAIDVSTGVLCRPSDTRLL